MLAATETEQPMIKPQLTKFLIFFFLTLAISLEFSSFLIHMELLLLAQLRLISRSTPPSRRHQPPLGLFPSFTPDFDAAPDPFSTFINQASLPP